MFSSMTVGARLAALVALLALTIVLVGAAGSHGMNYSNDRLKTVYEDRTVVLVQLAKISDAGFALRDNIAAAVNAGAAPDLARLARDNQQLEAAAGVQWKAYLATYLTPEEKAIASAFQQAWSAYHEQRKQLELALHGADRAAAGVGMAKLEQQFQAAHGELVRLRTLQEEVAKSEYASARADTTRTLRITIGLALLGLAAGIALAWRLIRGLQAELGGEPAYAAQIVRDVAAGRLGVEVQLRRDDQSSLLAAMKLMVENLSRTVGAVRASSDSINNAADEIAQGNLDLSSRTEQQAASLEETAATMEQLTGAVRLTADKARQANLLVASTADLAEHSGDAVLRMVDTMGAIRDSSAKIADIISVIDGIAFQTNILALNAAVEAARAGEQGRGFAVVASEVRSLAHRVTMAAREVKELIDASVGQVQEGGRQVGQTGDAMQRIVDSVKQVATLIEDIATASSEQSAGIAQVNVTVSEMDSATQQNAALVEEAAATSASMQEQAHVMADAVSVFELPQGQRVHLRVAGGLPAPVSPQRAVVVRKAA